MSELTVEYQTVEYLEGDGNSYIDTLINAHSNMQCKMKFEFTQLPSDATLLGSKAGDNRLYFYHYYNGNTIGYGNYYTLETLNINTIYNLKTDLSVRNQKMTINDVDVIVKDINKYYNTYNTICVYSKHGSTDVCCKAKIYDIKLYENYNICSYLIPVYKKSDNTPGFYDVVNKRFLTNLGSGNFTVGQNTTIIFDTADLTF